MSIASWFQRGGVTMLWIAMLVVPTLVIAAFHMISPRRWAAWVGGSLVALVLAIGAFGTLHSRARTDSALEGMSDAESPDRELIRDEGYAEARVPMEFAGGVAALALVALAIGHARRQRT